MVPLANSLYDARAAAVVFASVANPAGTAIKPLDWDTRWDDFDPNALLEQKNYGTLAPRILLPTAKCMSAMAYADYFPDSPEGGPLRDKVSRAIMLASPGWCGSFGPGVDGAVSLNNASEGNYDMTEMHLIPIIYRYYDELTPAARERVITLLLNLGRIHRPRLDDTFTSGGTPDDWSRAGFVSPAAFHYTIPETENHVLMIATARYLTNQLLYQRLNDPIHDNRRNGDAAHGRPSSFEVLLELLQNMLRDDFSEYNAKPYQEETRWALLNLSNYAYDAEVRLSARMVLDYISAHIAVSSSDLRRMVPFRRRYDEGDNGRLLSTDPNSPDFGFMDFGLLDHAADPMADCFAMLAGNTRGFELANLRPWPLDETKPNDTRPARPWAWGLGTQFELAHDALSDYRIPPSVHDLFVNDLHRRFFQRLHRTPQPNEPGGQRNCNNREIYAGSPSYLITAGGVAATWVIPGQDTPLGPKGYQDQNKGVAVPTSFMPTGLSAGVATPDARDLIQFSHFTTEWDATPKGYSGQTENYGVAPDFACGVKVHLPDWAQGNNQVPDGDFIFINKGSISSDTAVKRLRSINGRPERAGFFLAIHQDGDLAIMEAFDTWLHPEVSFATFRQRVRRDNPNVHLTSAKESVYKTQNGNRIHFVIWNAADQTDENYRVGSKITRIDYGDGDPADTLANAGAQTDAFLNGTILGSPGDAVVTITNPYLQTTLTLDLHDRLHPRRVSESGQIEEAGNNHEVWVDFDSRVSDAPAIHPGDFYHPFKSLDTAISAVAGGGDIKITPGTGHVTTIGNHHKRMTLIAPIGGVTLRAR